MTHGEHIKILIAVDGHCAIDAINPRDLIGGVGFDGESACCWS